MMICCFADDLGLPGRGARLTEDSGTKYFSKQDLETGTLSGLDGGTGDCAGRNSGMGAGGGSGCVVERHKKTASWLNSTTYSNRERSLRVRGSIGNTERKTEKYTEKTQKTNGGENASKLLGRVFCHDTAVQEIKEQGTRRCRRIHKNNL